MGAFHEVMMNENIVIGFVNNILHKILSNDASVFNYHLLGYY